MEATFVHALLTTLLNPCTENKMIKYKHYIVPQSSTYSYGNFHLEQRGTQDISDV